MKAKSAAVRKSKFDWIACATQAFAREGVAGVRVEALARELGVTKGSFYWHFSDVEALRRAVFEHWEQVGTRGIIEQVERVGGPARARLQHLWDVCARSDLDPELALRDFSRRDEGAARIVARVDDERMAYLRTLLTELGLPRAEIEARAMLMYSLLIGTYFIRTRHGKKPRSAILNEALALVFGASSP